MHPCRVFNLKYLYLSMVLPWKSLVIYKRKFSFQHACKNGIGPKMCEWNPGNGKWYPVSRDNMEIEGDLKDLSNLMNAPLVGCVAKIRGSYSRKEKKLRLTL